jgi:hypothetical protein
LYNQVQQSTDWINKQNPKRMRICTIVIRGKFGDIPDHPTGICTKKNIDMGKAAKPHKQPAQQTVQTRKQQKNK